MIDYTLSYRTRLSADALTVVDQPWSVLISAYNDTERVQRVFHTLPADYRLWLVHSEYGYSPDEIDGIDGEILTVPDTAEADVVAAIVDRCSLDSGSAVCIDATGFMRQLVSLIGRLQQVGVERFWVIYSDPGRYQRDERTLFSLNGVAEVRPIAGFQGSHDVGRTDSDWIILGTGYDTAMMRAAIESKRHARRIDMYGLPSLQPSMYQENVLSVARLDEQAEASTEVDPIFAPANDPFATAQALGSVVRDRLRRDEISNLYLSPTGTKAQAIGFALYYLAECQGLPASMLVPLPVKYGRETSQGHARSWLYEVDRRIWGG